MSSGNNLLRRALARLKRVIRHPVRGWSRGSDLFISGHVRYTDWWVAETRAGGSTDEIRRPERRKLGLIDPGKRVDSNLRTGFLWNSTLENQDVFTLETQGAGFSGWGHAIINRDGQLLRDLSLFSYAPDNDPSFRKICEPRFLPAKHLEGKSLALLAPNAGHNYFHWLFDLVPQIHVLEQTGVNYDDFDRIIVNRPKISASGEWLKTLPIDYQKLVYLEDIGNFVAEKLVVTSRPLYRLGIVPCWVVRFLRDRYFPQTESNPGRRLFIHRDPGRRTLANQEEIEQCLQNHGFEVLRLESQSWAEQRKAFAEASAVIAVHGAALANLAFAMPGTKVFEIHPPGVRMGCYHWLSHWNHLEYFWAEAEGLAGAKEGTIRLDVSILKEFLRYLPK